jgi:hypothetical protein
VTGGPINFVGVLAGGKSATSTLLLENSGTVAASSITVVLSGPFHSVVGGTCGTTLAVGHSCTIFVDFAPTVAGAASGTVTITANVPVINSPVPLSGTGLTTSKTLTPATWTVSQARNCPGTGTAGIQACSLDPKQIFTLTNTGTAAITAVAQGVLGGTNASEFSIVRSQSTCGPAGNGQTTSNANLSAGNSCIVTVQFKPLTSQTTGTKTASLSIVTSTGTATANLTGTAQ